MTSLDLIRVSKDAYFDPDTGRGELTKVIATDKLLQIMEGLEGNPFKEIKPDLEAECILLRDRINDQRVLVPYDNDKTMKVLKKNRKILILA